MIKRLIYWLFPPAQWRLVAAIGGGVMVGLGFFLVHISNAASYLSDEPETCINCHVMFTHYSSWSHSSHANVATCNDCHVPHTNVFRKYLFKANDGRRHATIFSMRGEPQVIQIKQAGLNVVQENCVRCHYDLVSMTKLVEYTGRDHKNNTGLVCWDCHRHVPHTRVNSLGSAPQSLVPALPYVTPEWLKNYLNKPNKTN
jgi:cytochrome c nitrite reductase small subunit